MTRRCSDSHWQTWYVGRVCWWHARGGTRGKCFCFLADPLADVAAAASLLLSPLGVQVSNVVPAFSATYGMPKEGKVRCAVVWRA
jgi:hypothetical protein